MMTPELRARIRRIQERLDERGLQAIHFTIRAGPDCPPSHVSADICHAVEQWLDGKTRPLPPLGDSRRSPPPEPVRYRCAAHGATYCDRPECAAAFE